MDVTGHRPRAMRLCQSYLSTLLLMMSILKCFSVSLFTVYCSDEKCGVLSVPLFTIIQFHLLLKQQRRENEAICSNKRLGCRANYVR